MSNHIDDTTTEAPARRAPAKRAVPHKPLGVRQPQDHKKSAAQREAEGDQYVTITYGGLEFEILADQDDWPVLAIQAFSKRLGIDAIEHLLGPAQWARFVTRFPKKRQFDEFSEVIAAEFGFGSSGE
ncbi:hypothetical protein [Rhodococcus jostii]|uniref:hypothetical protein n=2 Tax=Rhodococcus jostii TaxID=132919 RepID=UPI003625C18E